MKILLLFVLKSIQGGEDWIK